MSDLDVTRRNLLATAAAVGGALAGGPFMPGSIPEATAQTALSVSEVLPVSFTVNGTQHKLSLDPRITLLDALREHIRLTGSKKGCDHGQCGACTVIVDGRRTLSCLTLAVMNEGKDVQTIEGLGTPDNLHPMQAAFIKRDGYQCGYCTPGQICSAVSVLAEIKSGIPSHATGDLTAPIEVSVTELRERMSGNICRCGAYSNIVEAITDVIGDRT